MAVVYLVLLRSANEEKKDKKNMSIFSISDLYMYIYTNVHTVTLYKTDSFLLILSVTLIEKNNSVIYFLNLYILVTLL